MHYFLFFVVDFVILEAGQVSKAFKYVSDCISSNIVEQNKYSTHYIKCFRKQLFSEATKPTR